MTGPLDGVGIFDSHSARASASDPMGLGSRDSVDIVRGILAVADAKNGECRYVPLNSTALATLKALAARRNG